MAIIGQMIRFTPFRTVAYSLIAIIYGLSSAETARQGLDGVEMTMSEWQSAQAVAGVIGALKALAIVFAIDIGWHLLSAAFRGKLASK